MSYQSAPELSLRPMVRADLPWVFQLISQDADAGHYDAHGPSSGPRWQAFLEVLARAKRQGEIADHTGHLHRFVAEVAVHQGVPCAVAMLRIDLAVELFMFSVLRAHRHQRIGKRFLDALLADERFRGQAWFACCHPVSADMKFMLLHRRFALMSTSASGACVLGRGIKMDAIRVPDPDQVPMLPPQGGSRKGCRSMRVQAE